MEDWKTFIGTTIELLGFHEWNVEIDHESRHGTIFIHDHPALVREHLPLLVKSINHIIQLVARKQNQPPIFFDINNYRREREKLIVELARAAARKVLATKEAISLPAMNAYERRIVHIELATHPDIATESVGVGKGRYVVVRRIEDAAVAPLSQGSRAAGESAAEEEKTS